MVKRLVENSRIFVEVVVLAKGVVIEADVEDDTTDVGLDSELDSTDVAVWSLLTVVNADGGLDGELDSTDVAVWSLLTVVNADGGPSIHRSVESQRNLLNKKW